MKEGWTENGKFAKGREKTGGRTKGTTGQQAVLQRFYNFIGSEETLDKLEESWVKARDNNALAFFMKVVVPLLPQRIIIQVFERLMAREEELDISGDERTVVKALLRRAIKKGNDLDVVERQLERLAADERRDRPVVLRRTLLPDPRKGNGGRSAG